MKTLKDYKGVAFIYVVLTLINVVWVIGYEKIDEIKQVSNEKTVVINV